MIEEKKPDEILKKANEIFKNKKILAALSYIWVLCIIPLLFSRDEFVKFHARQGFVLFIIEVALVLVIWIPFIGWLLGLVVGIVALVGVLKALNGEKWEIPYIYNLSKKIKI